MASEIENEKRKQECEKMKEMAERVRKEATMEQLAVFDSWPAAKRHVLLLFLYNHLAELDGLFDAINEQSIDEAFMRYFKWANSGIMLLSDEEEKYARKKGWDPGWMKCIKCGCTLHYMIDEDWSD